MIDLCVNRSLMLGEGLGMRVERTIADFYVWDWCLDYDFAVILLFNFEFTLLGLIDLADAPPKLFGLSF